MTTRLIQALEALPDTIRPIAAFATSEYWERFVVLQPQGLPDFGFLVRESSEVRFGWERWITIRESTMRVRMASFAGEIDAVALSGAARKIAAACRDIGVASLIIHHADGSPGAEPLKDLDGIHVVNLADYPLALLARYGMEVIADALAWIDFDARWCDQHGSMREPLRPRPITADRLRFLECHTAHLEHDVARARRFYR